MCLLYVTFSQTIEAQCSSTMDINAGQTLTLSMDGSTGKTLAVLLDASKLWCRHCINYFVYNLRLPIPADYSISS